MIDTHAHINSKCLKDVRQEIMKVKDLEYLDKVINVGLDEETSIDALANTGLCDKFYAAIGVHPLYEGNIENILKIAEASALSNRIVAIGETGLDDSEDLKPQIRKFIESIELANMLHLPIIIHANNTNDLVLKILKGHPAHYGFVFHCFQPDLFSLESILKRDGYISVGRPITKENAKKSLEVVRNVPIDNLLIELDYPFMSGIPEDDGKKVFNRIKEIRKMDYSHLEESLDKNAKRLFYKLKN